ncbi:MAG: metal-dependent hydrolase [Chitinophagaceae bacterium]|nr:MAG: metal-dependent hydrolase [Chitinophagaceae bacterium]
MDSLTHIVLGACIGEAVAGKKLGKKAMLLGAVAQSLPDVDFVTTFFLSDSADIVAHRGITHSLIFGVVATFLFSGICRLIFRKIKIGWNTWFWLLGLNIFVHLLMDGFNAYGIGWLEPFSHKRFSFHVLFVADPLFSIWPFIAFVFLLTLGNTSIERRLWWRVGIGLSTIYLCYAIINKVVVNNAVEKNLAQQKIAYTEYFTTPTPFNSWLWFVIAKGQDGYYISYRSVFDSKKPMRFEYFPRNEKLLTRIYNQEEIKDLLRFADGYYTVEQKNDTTTFNVLRFGQVIGWHNPREKFAFYYFLDCPGSNEVVAQRGRFEKWDRETISSFFQRIRGQ